MQVAIVGLPSSGKTTVFDLLTGSGPDGDGDNPGAAARGKSEVAIRMARVPDGRISYLDFRASGPASAARARGLYRLEGKDYIVKDGDIINFRFSK